MRWGTHGTRATPVLLALLMLLTQGRGQSCSPYTGSICQGLYNSSSEVWSFLPPQLTESLALQMGYANLSLIANAVDPKCAQAAQAYICTWQMPPCNDARDGPVAVCTSACNRYVSECGDLLATQGIKPEPCGSASVELSTCMDTAAPSLPQDFECPEPMIRNPNPGVENPFCFGECCVPCPQGNYFYPEGQMEAEEIMISVLSLLSFVGTLFLFVTYLLMPEKREYPQVIILFISFSLMLLTAGLLGSLDDRDRMRCIDSVTPSSPGNNKNSLCMATSVMSVFGFLSAASWHFVAVLNIYENVIFMTTRLSEFRKAIFIICTLFPTIPVIVVLALDKTGYIFGNWCVVDFGYYMDGILMIPVAAMLFPSLALNIHVLVRIAQIAKARKATLNAILKLQIRFLAFELTLLAFFLFFWLHYRLRLSKLQTTPGTPWMMEWFICVAQGNGRDACSVVARPHVPEIISFAISEAIVCLVGIVIFAFFGLRRELFDFWREVLGGNLSRIRDSSFSDSNLARGTLASRLEKQRVEKEEQITMTAG